MLTLKGFALLIISLLFCSCARKTQEIERAGPPYPEDVLITESEPGEYGGMVVLTQTSQPTTFNQMVPNNMVTSLVIDKFLAALIAYDPVSEAFVPELAKSWEVSADGRSYTFHLRKGIEWSDGQPFTVDDVIFTFDMLLADEPDEKSGKSVPLYPTRYYQKYIYDGVKLKYEKVGDSSVRFTTPTVYAPLLYDLGFNIFPKHKFEQAHLEKKALKKWTTQTAIDSPEELIGTGPYLVDYYQPGERLVMKPNPRYWKVDQKGQRLPYLDRLICKFVTEGNTAVIYFATGQSDAEGIKPSDVAWMQKASEIYDFEIVNRGASSSIHFIWLNQNPGKDEKGKPYVEPHKLKWFTNKNFRKALVYAFNREGLIDAIYFGDGQHLHSNLSPAQGKWYNDQVTKYDYDPEKAVALLEAEGFKRDAEGVMHDALGNKVEFSLSLPSGGKTWEDMITTFKSNLEDIGIQLNIMPIDFATLTRKMDQTFDYEAAVIGWGSSSAAYDPSGSKAMYLSKGIYHLWYPKQEEPATEWEARIDRLFKEQEKTLDEEVRIAKMHEIQAILADETPMIFLPIPNAYTGMQRHLKNVVIPPAGTSLWNIEEIWSTRAAE